MYTFFPGIRHHGIQQLTVDNSRSCFVKGYKSTLFLSSRGSRGAWSKDVRHGYGKSEIKFLSLERGNVRTDTRQVRIAAEGDPRQWVTGALIGQGSTGTTVIILSKPPTLCVGNLLYEKEHSCFPIYSSSKYIFIITLASYKPVYCNTQLQKHYVNICID